VRKRTLELVEPQRQELLSLFDAALIENGSKARFGKAWPFHDDRRLGGWRPLPLIARELDGLIG
jgi:hypothetical protein